MRQKIILELETRCRAVVKLNDRSLFFSTLKFSQLYILQLLPVAVGKAWYNTTLERNS